MPTLKLRINIILPTDRPTLNNYPNCPCNEIFKLLSAIFIKFIIHLI